MLSLSFPAVNTPFQALRCSVVRVNSSREALYCGVHAPSRRCHTQNRLEAIRVYSSPHVALDRRLLDPTT